MIGIEGRLQVRNYENRSPALSSEALSHPQLVGNKAGVRQYLSEILVNRFTFLKYKKSSTIAEPVEPFNPAMESNINPFDPNFSNANYSPTSQNYNNPFTTATTLAGSLNKTMNTTMNSISIHDEVLPF